MAWNAVRALLDAGADVNAATSADGTGTAGRTALMWAASRGSVDGVNLLLNSGARLDTRDANGATVLHDAAWLEHNGDVVRRLVAAGANPDQPALHGITPLMQAAQVADTATVRALLDAGANPNLRDAYGQTALDRARTRGADDVVAALIAAGARDNG
jgi:ankyrin repeat protein